MPLLCHALLAGRTVIENLLHIMAVQVQSRQEMFKVMQCFVSTDQ